jgi:hypothetical protein
LSIMNCYRFLDISWKLHYVMNIQKLYMKFIQCDYIIYNIVVLAFYHFHQLYLITWPITNFKILQKLSCDNILWTMECALTQWSWITKIVQFWANVCHAYIISFVGQNCDVCNLLFWFWPSTSLQVKVWQKLGHPNFGWLNDQFGSSMMTTQWYASFSSQLVTKLGHLFSPSK